MNMQEHMLDTINGNTGGPGVGGTPNTHPWPMQLPDGPPGPPGGPLDLPNGPEFMVPHGGMPVSSEASMTSNSTSAASAASKKSSSRRNAWGNLSYADLITQAIQSTPEKRLTLSQVYEWMVANIPYFKDKGDSNSSAGWKVSLKIFLHF